ncbi:hypothetical protein K0M31_011388 [Melipona bicolor]|uniref:Uncharacterized protein n=1 Tax=Melipona bicolor TaxID=60889 RepID=A0AA40G9G4_9HYME|nr:hypothetical protein K0M31_011388 [Melipona bicolor]
MGKRFEYDRVTRVGKKIFYEKYNQTNNRITGRNSTKTRANLLVDVANWDSTLEESINRNTFQFVSFVRDTVLDWQLAVGFEESNEQISVSNRTIRGNSLIGTSKKRDRKRRKEEFQALITG